jgi:NRPS condensation-like uncharacterized protein
LQYLSQLARADARFQLTSTSKERAMLFNRFLWKDYTNRVMEASTANSTHIVMRIKGNILTDALLKSITFLLKRHEVLSSSIEMPEGNLYLVHRPKQAPVFQVVVIEGETIDYREKEGMRIASDLIWKEYNLNSGPLYRVFLIRLSMNDYIVGVGLHHAIGDAISVGIFFQEIITVYNSIVTRIPPRLSPVRFGYIDYLASMEIWSTSSSCMEHVNYWKDRLRSTPVTGLLPKERLTFGKSIAVKSAEEKIFFDSDLTRNLKKTSANLKKTLFCVMLTAYKVATWRMTGDEEPVVISLQAGRLNTDFQNIIGNFAMEVAYKTSLKGNPSFTEISKRIEHTMNEAQVHQPIPLDWVRRALADEGISFNAPGMSLLSGDTDESQDVSGSQQLLFPPPGVPHGCHGFPVSCAMEFRDRFGKIEGSMVYRKDIYNELTIKKFLNHFQKVIIEVINDPGKKLHDFTGSSIKYQASSIQHLESRI